MGGSVLQRKTQMPFVLTKLGS